MRITFTVPAKLAAEIEDIRFGQRRRNLTETVNHVLEQGVKAIAAAEKAARV
jgi:hypothetical protein